MRELHTQVRACIRHWRKVIFRNHNHRYVGIARFPMRVCDPESEQIVPCGGDVHQMEEWLRCALQVHWSRSSQLHPAILQGALREKERGNQVSMLVCTSAHMRITSLSLCVYTVYIYILMYIK